MRSLLSFSTLTLAALLGLACTADDPEGAGTTTGSDGGGGGHTIFDDWDRDGHPAPEDGGEDCDDHDDTIYPGAPDTVGDGIDQNCDGSDGVDADGDGHASESSGGDDCDDEVDTIHPGAGDAPGTLQKSPVLEETEDIYGGYAHPRMTLDAEGAAHIVVDDPFKTGNLVQKRVWYGTNKSGEWAWEILGARIHASAPVVAADGAVHVVTRDIDANVALRSRSAGETSWTTEMLGDAMGYGSLSPQLDAEGALHIAWTQADNCIYSTNATGTFVHETILAAATCVLALTSSGEPRIAFVADAPTESLHLATPTASSWTTSPIVEDIRIDGFEVLVDGADATHVVHWGDEAATSDADIVVSQATEAGNGWTHQELYRTPVSSIDGIHATFDQSDVLHALITTGGYEDSIFYLSLAPAGDPSVNLVYADDLSSAGSPGPADIFVDSEGTAHVTFEERYTLYYGEVAAPNGIDDDCDGIAW